jgi:hypothetical protein
MSNMPINPKVSSVESKVAAKTRMMGPVARIGISLGFLIAGAKLTQDSYKSTQIKRQDAVDYAKEHAEWSDMEFGMGHYSGSLLGDKAAHWWNRLLLFGPMNLRIKWQEIKIRVNSWVNDVILPNLLPIAMMVGGGIGIIGLKNIHGGSKATGHFFRNYVHIPASFKTGMKQVAGKTAQGTGKGLGKLVSLPFKSPAHLGVAGAGLLLGAFALSRFQNSYGHDGQHQYFRDLINVKGHHEDE